MQTFNQMVAVWSYKGNAVVYGKNVIYISFEVFVEMITLEQAKTLKKEADENGGKCTNCHHAINIYEYPVNKVMVKFLRAMQKATDDTKSREIDVETVSVIHHERTQITKLRIHGLIAKVKDENGKHKSRMWLITRKGWDFLNGQEIPRKVVIYNNQVLGHTGGNITISQIDKDAGEFNKRSITAPESKVYSDVRTPARMTEHYAEYQRTSNKDLLKGTCYTILVERLQVGKPVHVKAVVPSLSEPVPLMYQDIASFQRSWKITK